ncbi:MAG: inositol monophosphatase family protein, partial [Pseudomonadota bacterium]
AANSLLQEVLLSGIRNDYGWLSEETVDDQSRLHAQRTIIVDPIDGTRAFLRGEEEFTVCIAICEGCETVASVIYCPAKDEMFDAALGQGARLNDETIRASHQSTLQDSRMIGQRRMFDHPSWPHAWPAMDVIYKNSTSYRMALVASGVADGTIALARKADWDVAPGALIAKEAGALASDHLKRPFRFCQAEPVQPALVCTAAPLYPKVINRLAHLPSDLRTLQP